MIHVDADPCVLGANFAPDLAILGDSADIIEKLIASLRAKSGLLLGNLSNWSCHLF